MNGIIRYAFSRRISSLEQAAKEAHDCNIAVGTPYRDAIISCSDAAILLRRLSKYRNAAPAAPAPDSGEDALTIFKDCCIREYHTMATNKQIEHYEFDIRMSGDQYRQFIAALSKKRGG